MAGHAPARTLDRTAAPAPEAEADQMAPARGLIVGLGASAVLWGAIVLGLRAAWG